MNFLQANMHRSRTADSLLAQIVLERRVDAVIISEQYTGNSNGNFLADNTKTAGIWLPNTSNFYISSSGAGDGFVWARNNMLTLVSCYLTPSDNVVSFQAKLDAIEDCALQLGGNVIIAGDFNSQAIEWGMPATNPRGRRVLDMAARLGLVIANTGTVSTFRRHGCEGTIPDITMVSERIACTLKEWTVLEDYTGSDHQYIWFTVEPNGTPSPGPGKTSTRIWNAKKLIPELFLTVLNENVSMFDGPGDAESLVRDTMFSISQACDAAMPRVPKKQRKKAAYWWNKEIAELRRVCLRLRRRVTRARTRSDASPEIEEYKMARRSLKRAIETSKRRKWEELREEINTDPWGLGYKIVTRKLGALAPAPELEDRVMYNIVSSLFPDHEVRRDSPILICEDPPLFTEDELRDAASSLKNNKAPGPDGIPVEALKLIADVHPQILLSMFNACLVEGLFPAAWKRAQLMLISKGKGDPEKPNAYRPLCLLDTAGKLLEKLLKPRIAQAMERAGGLSKQQHGFRKGKSTIGAIEDVVKTAEVAQSGNAFSKRVVLVAALDVRNAFNSLRWVDVIESLRRRFRLPPYLLRMVCSYLKDRELLYHTQGGLKHKTITSGAAQGSILGPDLWNASYDDIFSIEMPDGTHLSGYADDIAAIIIARDEVEAQRKLNMVMIRTRTWLESRGLQLAAEKTELVMLTKRHIPLEINMQVSDQVIRTTRTLNYLGVRLDPRMTFWAQIHYAAKKASKASASLSRLMANIGGPTASKRKLLMSTVNAVLLYGSEVWADALGVKQKCKMLTAVQRTAALRVASAYRTVSVAAVLVISSSVPIDLMAAERRRVWLKRQINGVGKTEREEARLQTLQEWQHHWNTDTSGRWTARLIPDVSVWVNRKFGEVDYYLTQMLSGHGYFGKYLHRMKIRERPNCIYCDADEDDAEHTFFDCSRWSAERECLEELIGGAWRPDSVVWLLLQSEQKWHYIAQYTQRILRTKKKRLDAGTTET